MSGFTGLGEFFLSPSSGAFATGIGIVYVVVGYAARSFAAALVEHEHNRWETFGWLSVELALLSVTLSVTADAVGLLKFPREAAAWWYIALVGCFIVGWGMYASLIKCCVGRKKGKRIGSGRMVFLLLAGWASGLLAFVPTVEALAR
jgi:hypothetical protein